MAVKIRLKRMGKIRAPFYRIVVVDSRKKRDGKVIEEIGKYDPTQHPSLIEIDSERAQYWLSVGAQPTEPVLAQLKITGDWQKFKGLDGAEGTLQVKESVDREEARKEAAKAVQDEAEKRRAAIAEAKAKAEEEAKKAAEEEAAEAGASEEAPAEEAAADEAPAEDAAPAEEAAADEAPAEESAEEAPAEEAGEEA